MAKPRRFRFTPVLDAKKPTYRVAVERDGMFVFIGTIQRVSGRHINADEAWEATGRDNDHRAVHENRAQAALALEWDGNGYPFPFPKVREREVIPA